MTHPAGHCELCGLPLRFGSRQMKFRNRSFHFCCTGCRMVYSMLMEAGDSRDPDEFKESELFQRCMELGLIPASEEHLARVADRENEDRTHPEGSDGIPPSADERHLSIKWKVTGMWCPACAWAIEEILKKQPGVADAGCNFSTDRLSCRYDPVVTTPERLKAALIHLGYPPVPTVDPVSSPERRRELIRLIVSALLTANIMMLSVALYTGFFSDLGAEAVRNISWPMAAMAGAVFFYGGSRIHRRAWAGIVHSAPGMETLVSLGAGAAFFYSLAGTLSGSIHQYYDTASMLVTLILIGKSIEEKAKDEVNRDLESFFERTPEKVKLCTEDRPDGVYVQADRLVSGDLFVATSGEMLAADGIVVKGEAMVDESSITGEARSVGKETGATVTAGTTLRSGRLFVRATAVGAESTLGRMVAVMERSLSRKIPLEGKTDRILHGFVPAIVSLAIATAVVCLANGKSADTAVIRAVTVLVIACPCALGVAIPLTRVAGISMARKLGILVNNFSAFESMQKIDTVVLDKTGTVTEGNWRILTVERFGAIPEKEIIAIAAGLETDSRHPIAEEIRRYAADRDILPATVESRNVFPNGIQGKWKAKTVSIGAASFAGTGTDRRSGQPEDAHGERLTSQVFVSVDRQVVGIVTFGDRLKQTSAETASRLQNEGFYLRLVSGDGESTVAAVAKALGITSFAGEKKPEEKAEMIQQLKQRGNMVAMVGDGVNDAPALARSHVAVAVPSGTHPGWEATDVTLMKGDPAQVLDFMELAARVNRTISQNLFFAFGYNLLAIPVAMAGLLSPPVAALAMVASSLSVTGNTLRMIRNR